MTDPVEPVEEQQRKPRSMGSLNTGAPKYNFSSEIFSTTMRYVCNWRIGDDEMKSAMLVAVKQFHGMLRSNGFWYVGAVATEIDMARDGKTAFIKMQAIARAKPAVFN